LLQASREEWLSMAASSCGRAGAPYLIVLTAYEEGIRLVKKHTR